MDGVAHEPLAVGTLRGDLALDLAVLDDAPLCEVDEEQLAGLQAAEAGDALGGDVEEPGLRAQHDVPVGGLNPAPGAQSVAVERRADDAPVGEGDRGGAVPGLHQAGVEGVEALQVVGQVGAIAEGLGDHHHHGVGQLAAGEQQQLEHVVEGRRVGVAGADDGQDLGEVLAEQLAGELGLARAHPVDVAHHGVDLAVVAGHAVGVGQLPGGERVGGEARVHQRHSALAALVLQVGVEAGELVADQHALVVERARGARGHIQARLGGELADAADHIQLALEGILVKCAGTASGRSTTGLRPSGLRSAGDGGARPERPHADEQLADHGPAGPGGATAVFGATGTSRQPSTR